MIHPKVTMGKKGQLGDGGGGHKSCKFLYPHGRSFPDILFLRFADVRAPTATFLSVNHPTPTDTRALLGHGGGCLHGHSFLRHSFYEACEGLQSPSLAVNALLRLPSWRTSGPSKIQATAGNKEFSYRTRVQPLPAPLLFLIPSASPIRRNVRRASGLIPCIDL